MVSIYSTEELLLRYYNIIGSDCDPFHWNLLWLSSLWSKLQRHCTQVRKRLVAINKLFCLKAERAFPAAGELFILLECVAALFFENYSYWMVLFSAELDLQSSVWGPLPLRHAGKWRALQYAIDIIPLERPDAGVTTSLATISSSTEYLAILVLCRSSSTLKIQIHLPAPLWTGLSRWETLQNLWEHLCLIAIRLTPLFTQAKHFLAWAIASPFSHSL